MTLKNDSMETSDGMGFTSREGCISILLYIPSLSAKAASLAVRLAGPPSVSIYQQAKR